MGGMIRPFFKDRTEKNSFSGCVQMGIYRDECKNGK